MKLVITIGLDNAAMREEDDPEQIDVMSIVDVLRTLADKIEQDGEARDGLPIRDYNGNTIGQLTFTPDEADASTQWSANMHGDYTGGDR